VLFLLEVTPSIRLTQNTVGTTVEEKRLDTWIGRVPSREAASWVQDEWNYTTSGSVWVTPLIGDVDWDGLPEVVVASNDSVYYLSVSDTTGLLGNHSSRIQNCYFTSIAIGDLGLDGLLDTVVGSSEGLVQCIASSSADVWTYNATGFIKSLIVDDIDNDMLGEVLALSWDGTIYCINATGGLEWKYTTGYSVLAAPVLADVDRDGEIEMVVGHMNGTLYCFGGSGSVEWVFTLGVSTPAPTFYSPLTSIAVRDIDGDTIPEIIVVANSGLTCLHWHSPDGIHEEWAWAMGQSYVWNALAVGDLDGDETLEQVVGSLDGRVFCGTNTIANNWDFYAGGFVNNATVVIENIDNDTQNEVLFTSGDGNLYCLNSSGAIEWSHPNGNWFATAPAIGDIDQDNVTEIIVGCGDNKVYCLSAYSSTSLPPTSDVLDGGTDDSLDGGTNNGIGGGTNNLFLLPFVVLGVLSCLVPLTFVVVRRKRRADYSRGGSVTWTEERGVQEPYGALERATSLPIPANPVCSACGATLEPIDAPYCWNCGSSTQPSTAVSAPPARERLDLRTGGKCMVCGLQLKKLDEVLSCPYCGGLAHRTHLLEWLHVKDYCPTCRSHLDEQDTHS
jgi:outer membrane protein assembly factor BamB